MTACRDQNHGEARGTKLTRTAERRRFADNTQSPWCCGFVEIQIVGLGGSEGLRMKGQALARYETDGSE